MMGRRRETSFIFQSSLWAFSPVYGYSQPVLFLEGPAVFCSRWSHMRLKSTWKSPGTNLWVPPFRADFVMVGNSILQCSEPACARRRHFLQPARLFTLLLGALAEPRRAACTYLWLGKKTFSRIPANHQAAVLPARVRELQWSSRSLQVSKSKSLSSERWVTSLGACIWLLWDCGSCSKL